MRECQEIPFKQATNEEIVISAGLSLIFGAMAPLNHVVHIAAKLVQRQGTFIPTARGAEPTPSLRKDTIWSGALLQKLHRMALEDWT
jgi:hypothetical protein